MNIKEHYLEAKHEEQFKRINTDHNKKLKDLLQKYKKMEDEFYCYKKNVQTEMEKKLELNYSQS